MAKLTKKQFESVFREEILPYVIEGERSGFPDKPGRRQAWNDTVDAYIRDRRLPEAAGNWGHPSWLETWGRRPQHHATKKSSRNDRAATFTVHGHIQNCDGTSSAFWTRAGLSKAAALKLAKDQRAEQGGVAEVVGNLEPVGRQRSVHATTKKSPAQLDREIAEALTGPAALKGYKLKLDQGHGGEWWIWRTTLDGDIVNTIGPFRTQKGADDARVDLLKRSGAWDTSTAPATIKSDAPTKHLKCDMTSTCTTPVTHVDDKGYVYCTPHGVRRQAHNRCRKLTPAEKKKLEHGETIRY